MPDCFANNVNLTDTAPAHYKTGHTQTVPNTQILYYHESKTAAPEETLPLLEEEDTDLVLEEEKIRLAQSQYKWKRSIPASKFGIIINAKGNLKDQKVEEKVFQSPGKLGFFSSFILIV